MLSWPRSALPHTNLSIVISFQWLLILHISLSAWSCYLFSSEMQDQNFLLRPTSDLTFRFSKRICIWQCSHVILKSHAELQKEGVKLPFRNAWSAVRWLQNQEAESCWNPSKRCRPVLQIFQGCKEGTCLERVDSHSERNVSWDLLYSVELLPMLACTQTYIMSYKWLGWTSWVNIFETALLTTMTHESQRFSTRQSSKQSFKRTIDSNLFTTPVATLDRHDGNWHWTVV